MFNLQKMESCKVQVCPWIFFPLLAQQKLAILGTEKKLSLSAFFGGGALSRFQKLATN